MSFLSCLNHPTLVVASVGGVSLGVTLLLLPWKTMSSGNFLSSPSLAKQSEGNCTIINSEDLKNILKVAGKNEENYYLLSCEDANKEKGNLIPSKLEVAFPKFIFKKKDWSKSQKLEIRVKDETDDVLSNHGFDGDEWPYKITFSGGQFEDLIGKWNYSDYCRIKDNSYKVVGAVAELIQLQTDKNIYLLWTEKLN